MEDLEYLKRHLTIITRQDGRTVGTQSVCDPFHTTRVTLSWSVKDLLAAVMRGGLTTEVVVRVQAAGCAQGRWFRGPRLCECCGGGSTPLLGNQPGGLLVCEGCYFKFNSEAKEAQHAATAAVETTNGLQPHARPRRDSDQGGVDQGAMVAPPTAKAGRFWRWARRIASGR